MVGHHDWNFDLCTVEVDGRTLLASAGDDRTIQVWDPATGALVMTIPTHHPALAITPLGKGLAIGLTVGLLVVDLAAPGRSAQGRGQTFQG